MKKRKIKLQVLVLTLVAIGMTLIGIFVANNSPFSSNIIDSNKIKIRNGTNGNLYVLEDEDALLLSSKLLDLDVKVSGMNTWSSGYKYKIEFFVGESMEEIIIKSENSFVKGLLTYEANEDIVKLVESVISK